MTTLILIASSAKVRDGYVSFTLTSLGILEMVVVVELDHLVSATHYQKKKPNNFDRWRRYDEISVGFHAIPGGLWW